MYIIGACVKHGWVRNPGDKDDLIAGRVWDGEGEGALGFEGGLGVGGIASEAYWAGRGRNYCGGRGRGQELLREKQRFWGAEEGAVITA